MSRDVSPSQRSGQQPAHELRSGRQAEAPVKEYPVREYIGAMCLELAQMARWDEDERLAILLEAASARANEPRPDHPRRETAEPVARPA